MAKVCTRCGIEKDLVEFVKRSALKSGYAARCRECQVRYVMEWQKGNPEKVKKANKKWRDAHREHLREARRVWSKSEKCKEGKRRWRENNPEKYLVAINKAAKVRLSTLKGRLNLRISTAIRSSLNRKGGDKRNRHWESLVDLTIDQLKAHLEKKFTPEMSW